MVRRPARNTSDEHLIASLVFIFISSLTETLSKMLSETSIADEFLGAASNSPRETVPRRETVKIMTLDIGNYRSEDITWSVDKDHVTVTGKRCENVERGIRANKFTRKAPIPDGVDPSEIRARYNARDGEFVVEGIKGSTDRKTQTKTAYFDDHTATVTCDLGPHVQDLGLNYGPTTTRKISLFGDT